MSVYLKDIPLQRAQGQFHKLLQEHAMDGILGKETIQLDEYAVGRVLAEPVWAKISSPHYHASAMDGFAVRAAETRSAQPAHPVTLDGTDGFKYVDTGDPLPDGFDAVIPIENVESLDAEGRLAGDIRKPAIVRVRASVAPWTYVRPLGEDFVATQLVLPAGHLLRPVDLGAVAASGHASLVVSQRPRVAILPTGSELVSIGSELKKGNILEYNSLVLAAQVDTMGGQARRMPITPDDFDAICARIRDAAKESDLILINAGSSAGSEDFSAKAIETLGRVIVHGVAVRPGHPVIMGIVKDENHPGRFVPIVGVPGYPVSAALTVEIFVEPVLAMWLGRPSQELPAVNANLTRKITSPAGDDDYVRVVLGRVDEIMLAAPLPRGAGVISSLVRADGIVIVPRGEQGIEAGQLVRVRLYKPLSEIERTIFCIGSHDMTLDLLSQFLAAHRIRFVSSNVGSQGGLIALSRNEAHLAGSHLLDPESGEFNVKYIKDYLPDVPVRLVAFLKREQGLMVQKGNPLGIKSIEDIADPRVHYVNRQRGSGTRVLLDYHLGLKSISSEAIRGYENEEYTHLAVAAAIASGRADAGLGIPAAALALNLDFIPLFSEHYDLVIPERHASSRLLKPFFDVITDGDFKKAVSALPGYDVSNMGTVIRQLP
jgi:putative molybdopterin biosynthesis protein